jgi:hypothetical protein
VHLYDSQINPNPKFRESILTVAGGILLARYKSLRVEETPIRASPDLVDDIGLKVNVQRAGNVFA